jgi:hypothetical protein
MKKKEEKGKEEKGTQLISHIAGLKKSLRPLFFSKTQPRSPCLLMDVRFSQENNSVLDVRNVRCGLSYFQTTRRRIRTLIAKCCTGQK